jgi:hypothetical protein
MHQTSSGLVDAQNMSIEGGANAKLTLKKFELLREMQPMISSRENVNEMVQLTGLCSTSGGERHHLARMQALIQKESRLFDCVS